MSEFEFDNEVFIRISILSHPDEQTIQLIQSMVDKYPNQSTYSNISVISANVSTFKYRISENYVKIILVQPISKSFTEKLHTRFYKSSAAIILFSDHYSEVAAKVFYESYRKTVGSENPVNFIEIINDPNRIVITEPELLENSPNVAYYTIHAEDVDTFQQIVKSLAQKCYTNTQ